MRDYFYVWRIFRLLGLLPPRANRWQIRPQVRLVDFDTAMIGGGQESNLYQAAKATPAKRAMGADGLSEEKPLRRSGRVAFQIAVIVMTYVVIACFLGLDSALVQKQTELRLAYSSDLVMAFMIAHDLVRDPMALFAWYLSPANFAFPDMLVSVLLGLLRLPTTTLPMIYSGLLLAGLATSAGLVVSKVSNLTPLAGMLLFGAALALLMSAASATIVTAGGLDTTNLAFVAMHTGALVVGLATLALALHIADSPGEHRTSYRWMLALAAITGFSDLLYVVWFVVPIVVVWPWALRKLRWRLPAGLLVASIAGVLADRATLRPIEYGIADYTTAWHVWTSSLLGAAWRGDWIMLCLTLLAICMIAHALFILASRRRSASISGFEMAALALTGITVIALLVPLLGGHLPDSFSFRYSLPLFVLPYIWLIMVIAHVASARIVAAAGLVGALVMLAFAAIFGVPAIAAAAGLTQPSPMAACLLKMGLSDGISDYWNAKANIFSSDYRLSLVQVIDNGGRYPWATNSRWFTGKADGSGPVRPTFILINNLDPVAISKRFGAPSRIVSCDGQPVWLYDKPLPLP